MATSCSIKSRSIGKGKTILCVGEQPGPEEFKRGLAFVGPSGKKLEEYCAPFLSRYRFVFDNVIMHAGKGGPEDVERLFARIRRRKPAAIIALGELAHQAFGLHGKSTELNGKIHDTDQGWQVIASVHPAYVLRDERKEWMLRYSLHRIPEACGRKPAQWPTRQLVDGEIEEVLTDKVPVAAWDVETTALDPLRGRILCVGIYSPHYGKEALWFEWHECWRSFMHRWCTPAMRVLQNAKFDLGWMNDRRTSLLLHDTMLWDWLLHEDQPHSLAHLMMRYLPKLNYHWDAKLPNVKKAGIHTMEPEIGVCCALDARATYEIAKMQCQEELPDGMGELAERMHKLSLVLAWIEAAGTKINVRKLAQLRRQHERKVQREKMYFSTKHKVNIASPKQVGELIFDKWGIKPPVMTEKGNRSVSEKALELIADKHRDIRRLVEARLANTKLSNVFYPWTQRELDGYIYPQIGIGHVVSGRLSCSGPNLMAVDKDGPENAIFESRFPGGRILQADAKQYELRILAWLSGDVILRRAFVEGKDVHQVTADGLGISRYAGKQLNLAMGSGVGIKGLIREWGFAPREAGRSWNAWHKRYPKVRPWQMLQLKRAEVRGIVDNPLSRRRHINLKNERWRQMAISFPIQSTGADLLHIMVLAMHRFLANRLAKRKSLQLVPIHDCLRIDVYPGEAKDIKLACGRIIQQLPCPVPMEFEYKWMSRAKR